MAQPDGSSLDPETGSQFEFGQRFHIADDRLQLNTAVYRILRQNVAFRRSGNVYVQAGEIQSRGFEADLTTALTSRWRVNAGYAFTDAEFLDFEQSEGENLRGNTPTFAPRNTFNVWTAFDWRNGFGVNVGGRYFGRNFVDNGNVFDARRLRPGQRGRALPARRDGVRSSTSTTSPTRSTSCRTWITPRCIRATR